MKNSRKTNNLRSCSPAEKLLLDMVTHAFSLQSDPDEPAITVRSGTRTRISAVLIEELVNRDLIARKSTTFLPTDAGRAWVSRYLSPADEGFLHQHRVRRTSIVENDGLRRRVTINAAESPLAWLKSRQGTTISAAGFAAGERLRQDFTLAQLAPRLTTHWAPPEQRSTAGDPMMFCDTVLAARQRFARAMAHVGSEFQSILVDIVCFLKGLEQLEKERQWPARSAKVVLGLALEKLAHHYGICSQATGKKTSALRSWAAPPVQKAL